MFTYSDEIILLNLLKPLGIKISLPTAYICLELIFIYIYPYTIITYSYYDNIISIGLPINILLC